MMTLLFSFAHPDDESFCGAGTAMRYAAADGRFAMLPVVFGMVGVALLFLGTILLGFEATLALRSIHAEMDFLWKLGTHHAPESLRSRILSRRAWFERWR